MSPSWVWWRPRLEWWVFEFSRPQSLGQAVVVDWVTPPWDLPALLSVSAIKSLVKLMACEIEVSKMSWHLFQRYSESWGRYLLERGPCTQPLERGPSSQRTYCFSACVDLEEEITICLLLGRKGAAQWEARVQTGRHRTGTFIVNLPLIIEAHWNESPFSRKGCCKVFF